MYRVNETACTGCGDCVEACPAGAIALMESRAHIDRETCTECGSCAAACPEGAIVMALADSPALTAAEPARSLLPVVLPTPAAEPSGLANRPAVQVLAKRRTSRLWSTVGPLGAALESALVWAARDLLPEVIAGWRESRAGLSQSRGYKPKASGRRAAARRSGGQRHRWGRT
jgi:Fe-S-cluster-containing hydrogenase component 2